MSDVLDVQGLAKTWAGSGPEPVLAVRDVSLRVAAGETVVVTGPSGSGKTTLLSLLGVLVRPDRGVVRLDGVDLGRASERARQEARLRRIGFVFQRGLLLEYASVRQNVALVPRAAGTPAREAYAAADAMLERLGLASRRTALPAELSPGERQRVAVARALVLRPRLVLADEPTAHLDSDAGARVVRALREVATAATAALVIVTHDLRLTAASDRVLRLDDGRLEAAR